MEKRCFQLLDEINAYMKYLVSEQKLEVCVCNMRFLPPRFLERIAVYYGHSNPYCQKIKDGGKQRLCWRMQAFVRKKCQKNNAPFFGRCYAGVGECIFPILEREQYIGFLSVSGTEKTLKRVAPIVAPLVSSFRLLYLYAKELPSEKADEKEEIYRKTLRFIAENYTSKLTLEEIAGQLHYSASYLAHIFNAKNGCPIMRYIRALKIEKTRQLLLSTNKTVVEISQTVGFDTPNYLTAVFKKAHGLSPREYRTANASK